MARTATGESTDPEQAQVRMSFGEHLDELRRRIFAAMYGAIGGIAVCFFFINDIVAAIVRPYRVALSAHNLPDLFTYNKPAEIVINYLTLAFQAGLVVTSPWIIYQIWKFVAAGLYPKERKIVFRYMAPSVFLFLSGVAFFYFLVLPLTLNFFIGFTDQTAGPTPQPNFIEKLFIRGGGEAIPLDKLTKPEDAKYPPMPILPGDPPWPFPEATTGPTTAAGATTAATTGSEMAAATQPAQALLYFNARERKVKLRVGKDIYTMLVVQEGSLFANLPRLDDYLNFVMFTAILFGVAFELPMAIMVIAQIGVVEVQTFRSIRKYAYFGILVASVIAAPSADLMTMFALAIPLVGLYELGILLAVIVVRRQRKRDGEGV